MLIYHEYAIIENINIPEIEATKDREDEITLPTEEFGRLKKQSFEPAAIGPEEDQDPDNIAVNAHSIPSASGKEKYARYDKTVQRYTSEGVEFDAFWRCVSYTTEI